MFTDTEQFIYLKNRDTYFPGLWDLSKHHMMREHWKTVFRSNFDHIMGLIKEYRDTGTLERARKAQKDLESFLASLDTETFCSQHPTVHHITIFRENLFNRFNIQDPYREEKNLGNKQAMSLYRRVIDKIDALAGYAQKLRECCLRIFAGNIFDLGSVDISREHRNKKLKYGDLMKQVRRKTWFIDALDPWLETLNPQRGIEQKILFFVDNAGHDFVCGCIPMARTLAELGHTVIIAANESPSLNDVTFEEALIVFNRIQTMDPKLRRLKDSKMVRVITSGNTVPGIDFRCVHRQVNLDATDATQIILEGQGRAIETNWHTRFGIDCVRLSTVKEVTVAEAIGAKPLDMILRFDRVR